MEAHDLRPTRHSAAGDVKRLNKNRRNNNILQSKACYIMKTPNFSLDNSTFKQFITCMSKEINEAGLVGSRNNGFNLCSRREPPPASLPGDGCGQFAAVGLTQAKIAEAKASA